MGELLDHSRERSQATAVRLPNSLKVKVRERAATLKGWSQRTQSPGHKSLRPAARAKGTRDALQKCILGEKRKMDQAVSLLLFSTSKRQAAVFLTQKALWLV